MELAERVLSWIGLSLLFGGGCYLLLQRVGEENFFKAVAGLVHTDTNITLEMLVNIYLGAHEKPLAELTASDIKRLEHLFLWSLTKLTQETDPLKTISADKFLHLQTIATQIRTIKSTD